MTRAKRHSVISLSAVKTACSNCSLQQLCLPVGVGEDDMAKLDDLIRRRQCLERSRKVFHPGDNFTALYAIRSGSVKTYLVTEGGGEQITGFHLPGELIGLDAIATGRHPCGAMALETTSVCEIPYGQLESLADHVPSLGRQLLRIMSREIHADGRLLTLLGKKSAEERLAALLVSLSTRFHQRGFCDREFTLSMSRNDIGNYLGLAVETVSRLFGRFQQQHIIAVDHKRVRLLQPERLYTLAGFGAGGEQMAPCRRHHG